MMIELIGYFGSFLVVVSFFMSSVVKLRILNSIGGFIFAMYALIIQSYPTAVMNFSLVAINGYYLWRIRKNTQHFDLIDGSADDNFLNYLLNYYKDDIKIYFPEWNINDEKPDTAYIVCCDAVPAGILLGKAAGEETLEIMIDYSTPIYRDCSVGKYLYSRLSKQGIHKLVFSGNSEKHENYLQKMGFTKENNGYLKKLG